ncbi:MAG: putative adenylate kinase [Promethearchaeota archaeon]|nr:MAG: putative adenylate kinase [Candidatus Lokiarchaeota archaeon]
MKTIVISGTPGCGKTTVSKQISEKLKTELISLNNLVIDKKFYENYDEERQTYIADFPKLNAYMNKILRKAYRRKTTYMIIEGHFADIVPNQYINLAIVLRCHPDILKDRLKKRNYPNTKINENIQAEILGNCTSYLIEKQLTCPLYEIDTSNKSIQEVSEIIIKMIENDKIYKKYQFGNIDWLGELSDKDRLMQFFD